MRGALAGLALVAGILAGIAGCGEAGPGAPGARSAHAPPAGSSAPWNVVLLTVDTLRADHLGIYGYERDTTPALDAFARRAATFRNAFAVSPWTFPGVVSVLTGRYPAGHGFDARGRGINAEAAHLAGLFQQAGYRVPRLSFLRTVPGLEPLDLEDPWVGERERPGGPRLLQWLRDEQAATEPFFAWYHYRSLHLPYDPPEEHLAAFDAPPDTQAIRDLRSMVVIAAELQSFAPEERQAVIDLYDAQLRAFDEFFGELVAALDDTGLADRTVVVVTADHGEELLEHGLVGHASTTRYATLYDEVLRIPLIVAIPGGRGVQPECQVSQIDVAPTLLSLFGIEPPAGIEGRDLSSLLSGAACAEAPLFADSILGGYQAEGQSAREWVWAVRTPEWKLIERRGEGGTRTRELYQLQRDPLEQHDLSETEPEQADRLGEVLHRHVAAHGGPTPWVRPLLEAPGPRREVREIPAAPRLLAPTDGTVLTFETTEGFVRGRWTGSPRALYVIEYEIGTGELRTTGTLEVEGTSMSYGPMPLEIWQGMVQFNPWRFRIYPRADPSRSSEWVTVTVQ